MKISSSRVRKIALFSTAPLAVLVAGAMVWQGSQAAFTSSTRNSGNEWSTGSVVLTDDDLGSAMFQADNIVPGQTGEKCIVITSQSNVPGEVRAYNQNMIASRGLEDRIYFDLELGTGGTSNDCSTFVPTVNEVPARPLSTIEAANHDYASGGAPWTTTGTPGESQTYRATWRFDTTGMTQTQINDLQGARVTVDIVWELQSGDSPSRP